MKAACTSCLASAGKGAMEMVRPQALVPKEPGPLRRTGPGGVMDDGTAGPQVPFDNLMDMVQLIAAVGPDHHEVQVGALDAAGDYPQF